MFYIYMYKAITRLNFKNIILNEINIKRQILYDSACMMYLGGDQGVEGVENEESSISGYRVLLGSTKTLGNSSIAWN